MQNGMSNSSDDTEGVKRGVVVQMDKMLLMVLLVVFIFQNIKLNCMLNNSAETYFLYMRG